MHVAEQEEEEEVHAAEEQQGALQLSGLQRLSAGLFVC